LSFETSIDARRRHDNYSNPKRLKDIEQRLEKVKESGDPKSVLSDAEWENFLKNLEELKALEKRFFTQKFVKFTMDQVIKLQKFMTLFFSPQPTGQRMNELAEKLQSAYSQDRFYSKWNEKLDRSYASSSDLETWGDLLLRFSEDDRFRENWVLSFRETLPKLKELSQEWAFEDKSVRSVTVYNKGQAHEYWVLARKKRKGVLNKFEAFIKKNFLEAIEFDFKPTLHLNRVSLVEKKDDATVYHIEAIEKGRSMEYRINPGPLEGLHENFMIKPAGLLRSTKADELPQRQYIGESLNLFIGYRSIELGQVLELTHLNPELMASVGQFGFSVTGGGAQMVSTRTDTPQDQLLKLTASLIDIIDFANTNDVLKWFSRHTRLMKRVVGAGVGAGQKDKIKLKTLSCKKII